MLMVSVPSWIACALSCFGMRCRRAMLTFSSGRATVLQATHHLAVFGTFVFLSVEP